MLECNKACAELGALSDIVLNELGVVLRPGHNDAARVRRSSSRSKCTRNWASWLRAEASAF